MSVTDQVHADAVGNMELRPDAIDSLFHLAMPPVSPLDGIAGSCQQPII
jgi:hypothetical protein